MLLGGQKEGSKGAGARIMGGIEGGPDNSGGTMNMGPPGGRGCSIPGTTGGAKGGTFFTMWKIILYQNYSLNESFCFFSTLAHLNDYFK